MINDDKINSSSKYKKSYSKLSHSLVFWFLLLALLPLIIVSLFSYNQAKISLTKAASHELEVLSNLNVKYIKNWFDYRFIDLNNLASSSDNSSLLMSLSAGYKESGQTLNEYVKSYNWALKVDGKDKKLNTFNRQYDYVYDLFLIDVQGNILFTLAKESDFGTNLFNGRYSQTLFSKIARKSLASGRSLFSDLERYHPSNNTIAGFLSAPLLDNEGNIIGVLAVQLRLGKIMSLLADTEHRQPSLVHYLIGEDRKLRTAINSENEQILKRVIETEQVLKFEHEHGEHATEHDDQDEFAFDYKGPAGVTVIGQHQILRLPGVNWALISEINKKDALLAAEWLADLTLFVVIVTMIVVIIFAVLLARRITNPISSLADISMKVAEGDTDLTVKVSAKNEIGKLADAFNDMLVSRQQYERKLENITVESQKAYSELAEQKFALDQHSIVAITDVKGTITFVNSKFSEISGYSPAELIGQNHRLLNSGHHDVSFFKEMYREISKGHVWNAEICNRAKNGSLYWVDTTIVPFKGEDEKPKSYVAIRTDITERKKAELELLEAKDLAEAAVIAKSEFLASMSHEIRTPMNGVLGMLSLLHNTELDEVQKHRVEIAQSSAQSLLTLINDILDFSKVEAGKLDLEILDINLRRMLGEFAEGMGYQAQGKDLELIIDVTGIDQSKVKGDPGRLRQILTNLVGNAIKFTEQGEIVIRAGLYSEGNQYRMKCSISDTGIGIPEDKLENLFDSFSQVDASTTRKYGGTGLGLTIAKKLCELMGGDIQVRSEVGKGSCFEFEILLDKSDQSKQVVPKVDMHSLQLLIVDDNMTNREVLKRQFEHWGAKVVEAVDGQQAIEICETLVTQDNESLFDIVFLDMQMPGMDGAQLGDFFQKDPRFKSMKLVMMTSMGFHGDGRRFVEIGFSAYFPKPATTSDLFDALSVVADGGDALSSADPLVTHHYLKTLDKETDEQVDDKEGDWPENTRVLLVEDNQVNQIVAMATLEAIGVNVEVAGNGIEALDALKNAPEDARFSLIFMDCQMPEMDGFDASRCIRAGEAGKENIGLPIIALTANAMKEDRDKCLAAGMDDYLSKPFEQEQLHEKLVEWLL